ncbi:hypothetical protein [Xanthomonas campestris]|uniref:hypothetical protein n=1 Tax=Xanthomonas campestris TaxID=339 RepID=UPI0023EA3BAA|nr:hypothetical protein [Xanthomonas campestris]
MATNEKTGPKAAKAASKVLRSGSTGKDSKNSGRVRFESSAEQERQKQISERCSKPVGGVCTMASASSPSDLMRAITADDTASKKITGTPLTKPLHNGSVQTGTGVSCMGRKRGSTVFTGVRPLPWPFGLAVGVGAFFAIRTGVLWLLSHQSGPITEGFTQGNTAALAPIAWVALGMCLAAFAWLHSSDQRHKLPNIRTVLYSLGANDCCKFKLLVGEAFRSRIEAVEKTGLGGGGGGINLILRKGSLREMCGLPTRHSTHTVTI